MYREVGNMTQLWSMVHESIDAHSGRDHKEYGMDTKSEALEMQMRESLMLRITCWHSISHPSPSFHITSHLDNGVPAYYTYFGEYTYKCMSFILGISYRNRKDGMYSM